MTRCAAPSAAAVVLSGQRILFWGRLAGMSRREAQQLVRSRGGQVVESFAEPVDWIVCGEQSAVSHDEALRNLPEPLRDAAAAGTVAIVTESQLWQQLGLVEPQQDVHGLYTPAMLAQLLGVPLPMVRRWHRRGYIVPRREVRRLPYFDFEAVSVARPLADLLAAGVSPAAIERKLDELRRRLPGGEFPLAGLSMIAEGKQLLLRSGAALVEPSGQLRLDFSVPQSDELGTAAAECGVVSLAAHRGALPDDATPDQLVRLAQELEDQGALAEAAELYRAAMAAGGPRPELCFRLAELLYQAGDLSGARERYYLAIELDEDYVEARANLGCVLAEQGQCELAVAAFEGALAFHPHYADVHYHLARTLDRLHRAAEAELHWDDFLRLAPDSPWADEARWRLGDGVGP